MTGGPAGHAAEPEHGWDRFLTDRDRAHLDAGWAKSRAFGLGEHPALLLVDVYLGARGDDRLPLLDSIRRWPLSCGEEAWDAVERTVPLLEAARSAGTPVVHVTRDARIPLEAAFLTREPTSEVDRRRQYDIVPELAPVPGELIIHKPSASAFFGTSLIAELIRRRVDSVVICGQTTSGCVRATVVDAAAHTLKVAVVDACTFDRTEASHWMSLFDIHHKYGDVIDAATAADHLGRG